MSLTLKKLCTLKLLLLSFFFSHFDACCFLCNWNRNLLFAVFMSSTLMNFFFGIWLGASC